MTDQGATEPSRDIDNSAIGRRKRDRVRLRRIATRHGAFVLAALTLWGAADTWASTSGLLLAELIALFNAVFVGIAVSYVAHEWGHFAGARISGAVSPVLKEPRSFFMFNFKHELNTRGQFMALSLGGSIANWSLVLLLLIMLPLYTASQALIVAVTLGVAVSVAVFEWPVISQVMYGADPQETVELRQKEIGKSARHAGIIAGLVAFLIFV